MDKIYKVNSSHLPFNNIFLISDTHLGVRSNSLEWLLNIKNFFYEFYIPFLKKNMHEGDILFFFRGRFRFAPAS